MGMVIEYLRCEGDGEWEVRLCRANYRPERVYVEVSRRGMPDDFEGVDSSRAGFTDNDGEGDMLFDAVMRTIDIVTTGDCDDADWMELPDGIGPII